MFWINQAHQETRVSVVYANEMRVNWTEPSDDGGSPITGYVIEIKESDRQTWTEIETKNYKIAVKFEPYLCIQLFINLKVKVL